MPLDSEENGHDGLEGPSRFGSNITLATETGVDGWAPGRDQQYRAAAAFEIDLLGYWRILWKHRFLVLGAIAVALSIAVAVTLLTTPEYTATTTLQIDREAAKVVNLQDVTPSEQMGQAEEFYQTQYGLLKSRALAERVVASLGLASSPNFLRGAGLEAPSGSSATERQREIFRERVLKTVMSNLTVSPVRGSRLVVLSFNSRDPVMASLLTNSFAESFISSNLERRFESSSYARQFLERQLALAKIKLEDSERQSANYAASQQLISLHKGDPSSGTGPSTASESLAEAKLAALNNIYAQATAARIDAEQKWRQAQSTPGLGLTQVLASPTIQQLSQEKAKLQGEYENSGRLFKPDYPAMKELKAQIDELDSQIKGEANTIKQSLQAQYNTAVQQESALATQVDQLKVGVLDFNNRSIQYNVLLRESDTNRTLYNALLQRYKDVGVTGAVAANNILVIDRAEPPLRPSKPRPVVNLALGLILGIIGGVLGALGAEALDQALRAPGDIEAKLGIPLLGAIPLLTKGVTPAEAMKDPRSPFWEAYYSVRTALQFATSAGAPKSLLVISARPSEGKTTTSIALAYSFARLGAKTLLVDADLRNPSVHGQLGLSRERGFSNFLNGGMTLAEIVQPVEQEGLMVVACGPLPPTPAELLADMRLRSFIVEAEKTYDIVIFDGPPVMGFADSVMISGAVGGTALIVESGKTSRGQAGSALRRLRTARGRIVGAIMTKFDARKSTYAYGSGYEYHYSYDYGEAARIRANKVNG